MRAITISLVALIAYCTIVPVSSGSLPMATTTSPSTVHLARRQGNDEPVELPTNGTNSTDLGGSSEQPDVSKIVAEHPELGELDPTLVYFAFCSKTGESTCMDNYKAGYFNTILQKYFARFQFDQEIKDLDKVESTVANQGYTACYDVTMRDGLDALVKYSIATRSAVDPQPILEALKPEGRFHSFMLGSLYDSIQVYVPNIINILTNWVDCAKVEESYEAFCSRIQAALKDRDVRGIQKDSTIIDPDHLSYDRNLSTDSVEEAIPKFNRGTIDLARFLDQ
ncbi:hypothetical protein IWQ62_000200 [Dispira parvispora]|uniref:Uncharacterized protein n=1 Tax=Dispira parvispora TaxID=1520584 RepID=A0A9W8AYX0_9FUNG|nr:hypothetical protein IWQ62_000200 [Dispira parvispora]